MIVAVISFNGAMLFHQMREEIIKKMTTKDLFPLKDEQAIEEEEEEEADLENLAVADSGNLTEAEVETMRLGPRLMSKCSRIEFGRQDPDPIGAAAADREGEAQEDEAGSVGIEVAAVFRLEEKRNFNNFKQRIFAQILAIFGFFFGNFWKFSSFVFVSEILAFFANFFCMKKRDL